MHLDHERLAHEVVSHSLGIGLGLVGQRELGLVLLVRSKMRQLPATNESVEAVDVEDAINKIGGLPVDENNHEDTETEVKLEEE